MKVLIVEDNVEKSRQLTAFLRSEFKNIFIEERNSYNSGLAAIRDLEPDIVLLDMSMPTYDRKGAQPPGRTRVYAGRDVLHEVRRLGLHTRAIVVTQFDTFKEGTQKRTLEELRKELATEFPRGYIDTVYYHPSRSDWRLQLEQLLRGESHKKGASTPRKT
jgi:CheY-like chemotaxis protein